MTSVPVWFLITWGLLFGWFIADLARDIYQAFWKYRVARWSDGYNDGYHEAQREADRAKPDEAH